MNYITKLANNTTKNIISKILPDFFFKKIPHEIIIEPTNVCNLKCPVCPTTFGMKRKTGFLKFETFKSIIDDIKPYKRKPQISMNFAGEPMLNKEIYSFVKYANQNSHKTFISTNVTAINEQNSRDLIQSGLDSINLCVDGFSNKSHDTYRIGSDFNIIKKNIETFMKVKQELKSKNPYVQIQTLLTTLSVPEKNDMVKWAKEIKVDSIYFKSLSMQLGHTKDIDPNVIKEIKEKWSFLVPLQEKFKRKQFSIAKNYCGIPLKQSVVYWNGDLGLCCIDYDNVIMNTNISDKGYLKTLFSNDVIKKRRLGLNKKQKICENCDLGNADYMGYQETIDQEISF